MWKWQAINHNLSYKIIVKKICGIVEFVILELVEEKE